MFCSDQKYFVFGIKIPSLGIFTQGFEKVIVTFTINLFELVKMVSFQQNEKALNFGTKIALLRFYCVVILRSYSHIWNQHPRICQNAKFPLNIKILKFGTKMPYLGVFRLQIKTVLFRINTSKLIRLGSFRKNKKLLYLATKMVYLCVFRLLY